MLTQGRLKEVLDYDPETGRFYWKVQDGGVRIGDRAGSVYGNGRRFIKISRKAYQEHRLAWLYVYGKFPSSDLDHINRDPGYNKIGNLRESNKSKNNGNIKTRRNGLKGAYWNKRDKRWYSTFFSKHLGCADTEQEAHELYCKAAKEYYGEFFYAG